MIVPRAIADANYASILREELSEAEFTVEEIVPLDWVCRQLFDSDVVPILLFVRKASRASEHRVRLVQCIQTKEQLLAYARTGQANGVKTSQIPWAEFEALPGDKWALEATPEDVPLLIKLGNAKTLEPVVETSPGITVGTKGTVADLPVPPERGGAIAGSTPMLTGSDVHCFFLDPPSRGVVINTCQNKSWWGDQPPRSLPEDVVAVASRHVTLNAAVMSRGAYCAQDTVVLVAPRPDGESTPQALAALINSTAARYYAFHVLRAAVAGGGRRDYRIYGSTVEKLPMPELEQSEINRLSELAREAQEAAQEATVREQPAWEEITAGLERTHMIADWPLNFTGWPDDATTQYDQAPALDTGKRKATLNVGSSISVTGDEELLRFLQQEWPKIFGSQRKITKNDLCLYQVPDPERARIAVQRYEGRLEEVTPAQQRYFAVLEQIDALIEEGFGLTKDERETLHRRMNEFPLSETANRPRLPWEETVAPRVKRFAEGERYHER